MEGGHPAAAQGPGGPPPPPMPPTGAMSGFGAEPPPPPPGFGSHGPSGAPAPKPPPPPPSSARIAGSANPIASKTGRALAGFLVSYQDDTNGKYWPLWQGRNVVGRAETGQDVDVAVGHGTTSTQHAAIECDGQRATLNDLGSTNGTFHNEEAIGFQGRRDLRDGDKVRFGGFSVLFINVAGRF
jgi:pSer/pThr/pTyr-binding forkhead associated (FHA) protein